MDFLCAHEFLLVNELLMCFLFFSVLFYSGLFIYLLVGFLTSDVGCPSV